MKLYFTKDRIKFYFLVALLFTFCLNSFAENLNLSNPDSTTDSFDIKNASFLLPQPHAKGKYTSAFYLLNIVIPRDWTLDIIKAPMFCYAGKYTFSHGFNLQSSLSTLFISNRMNLGPFWNYSINNYHFGVGYQVAFNYGILNQFGFHTRLTGWEQQPSATIGYSFKNIAITFRGDLYWTNSLYISEGGYTIPYTEDFINGYSVSGSIEQRLWKNHVLSWGFKLNYLRYHVIAWPAFPVNKKRYHVPEFQLGLNF